MPQNEYMERFTKLHGRRFDYEERTRKKEAREGKKVSEKAQNLRGLAAKQFAEKRRKEKIQMKQKIKAHEERNVKSAGPKEDNKEALPQFLLDRTKGQDAKALSSQIKEKRKEKAAKFSVPLPKVRGISEEEVFKVIKSGKKTHKKSWKRKIPATFLIKFRISSKAKCLQSCTRFFAVGQKPIQGAEQTFDLREALGIHLDEFGLTARFHRKKTTIIFDRMIAKPTFVGGTSVSSGQWDYGIRRFETMLPVVIISVKKNPQNPLYTQLGVLTRGVLWKSSNVVSMWVNVLWPFVPVAIILHFVAPGLHLWIFALSYISMIPVANLLGFAGQEFARKMPKVSGILLETAFGSVVEIVLFIILIAKHTSNDGSAEHGNFIPIIQAAILGSILTNLLLCLGLCFFVGGIRQQIATFHAVVSEVGSGILLVAGFGLLVPSAFYSALKGAAVPKPDGAKHHQFTNEKLQHSVLRISQITSILLIVAFVIYMWFNARSHHSIFDEVLEHDEHRDLDREYDISKPKFTFTECIVAIVASLTLVTLLAVFLVEKIDDVVEAGIPDQFLGLILLPLAEKSAEHLTVIDEAWDGQMNFALFHCLGPSIQTAIFNAPLVVLVGWALGKPMDLNFEIFMAILLLIAIIVVGNFLRDQECNYLEGALLVIVYLIIAAAAWYYPDPDVATSNGFQGLAGTVASKTR
ncbi:hypothetical protein FKW77_008454 [Venturia effusa]|uniref:Sodium/calcium exchanger membrane region domain-containing protein n=1 Tax=Venturia effusa TaxID=50376 RepID=A0A517LBF5_9PEZI|nr:hypothetical protein FKW77_008454 [Venturia effusa]